MNGGYISEVKTNRGLTKVPAAIPEAPPPPPPPTGASMLGNALTPCCCGALFPTDNCWFGIAEDN